jgi:hypothetical protein
MLATSAAATSFIAVSCVNLQLGQSYNILMTRKIWFGPHTETTQRGSGDVGMVAFCAVLRSDIKRWEA